MRASEKAFGETYSNRFKIGDLVYWITWEERESYQIDTIVHRGVLIEVINQVHGNREVVMGRVLPYGSKQMILINITLLRKTN